ncbi:MAG: hypothetical protein HZB16_08800 [Armatimonadetes bacterium]|nr:hypothetical protein [Armatimonadota bacterium]
MRVRRSVAVVMVLAICFAAVRTQAVVGLVLTEQGAQLLSAKITEWRNELTSEAASDANRAKLFERLRQARESLVPIKESTVQGVADLDKRIEHLRATHEGDPSGWAAADRAELQRTQAARDKLNGVAETLTGAWDNLKWLQGRQNVEGFNPFKNETFRDRFGQLGDQVGKAVDAFGQFNDTYRVETADRGNPNSPVVVVGASFATVQVVQPGVIWEVNGTTIGPEKGESVSIRMGDHRSLTIRAMAVDDMRRQIKNVREQVEAGKGQAVIDSKDAEANLLSHIKYHVGDLSTEQTCQTESYEWQYGRNVDSAVGKPSPWAASKVVIAAPVTSSSTEKRRNDTVTWWLPDVEQQAVVFSFTATGKLTWQRRRVMAGGRVVEAEVTGTQAGEVAVTVTGR